LLNKANSRYAFNQNCMDKLKTSPSIFVKFTVIISACLLLIFLTIAIVINKIQKESLLKTQEESANTLLKQISDSSAVDIKRVTYYLLDEKVVHLQLQPEILSVTIFNDENNVLTVSSVDPKSITVSSDYLLLKKSPCFYTNIHGKKEYVGRVEIIFSLEGIFQKAHKLRNMFFLIIVLAVVSIDAIVIFLLRNIVTNPLKLLGRSATQLSSGDFDIKNRVKTGDELGFLSKIIVDAGQKLAKSFDHIEVQNEKLMLAHQELQNHHDHLEDQVNERTKELFYAHEELKAAHEELEIKIEERTVDYKMAKLAAESANRAKSEFLSNMSHELRTPLHHILSYAQFGIKKADPAKNEKLRNYFLKIVDSGNRLLSLLNNLLDLSRLELGTMDYHMIRTSLVSLIDSSLEELSPVIAQREYCVKIEENGISSEIVCDAQKIKQVTYHILSNAFKYSPQGETITILLEEGELLVDPQQADGKTIPALVVNFLDRGVGLPDYELNEVFHKFIQSSKTKTGAGGTGLGLAISYEIIKAHHGKIWAENNPEGGATFSFMLPYKQDVD
jgi:signal transduction histidine kinase